MSLLLSTLCRRCCIAQRSRRAVVWRRHRARRARHRRQVATAADDARVAADARRPRSENIPIFVRSCVEYLCKPERLRSEGLFRLAGGAAACAALRDLYDQAHEIALDKAPTADTDTVATVLKQFFRELPEPLIPFDFFEHVLATHGASVSADAARARLLHIVSQLPRCNYDVLRYVLQFLQRCSQQAAHNKMTVDNLARVWGTNLMRRRVEPADGGMADIAQVNAGRRGAAWRGAARRGARRRR